MNRNTNNFPQLRWYHAVKSTVIILALSLIDGNPERPLKLMKTVLKEQEVVNASRGYV